MNDRRAAGQELQSQVLAAARKGQRRMRSAVKNMTSAAEHIRPQLANLPKPNLPKPNLNLSSLPGHAQLRERAQKAPEFATKLHSRLPGTLQSRVPSPDQVKSSAQQFAGHARTVQRNVVGQVRNVATPLAQQAAARFGQAGGPAGKPETTTRVSQVTVTKNDQAKNDQGKNDQAQSDQGKSDKPKNSGSAKTSSKTSTAGKTGASAKSSARPASPGSGSAKPPRSKPAGS